MASKSPLLSDTSNDRSALNDGPDRQPPVPRGVPGALFPIGDFRAAVAYHLAFHHATATHLNHLVFG